MASQGQYQTTTQCRSVQRGDHRPVKLLDLAVDLKKIRFFHFRQRQLTDVGTGYKGSTFRVQDHDLDAVILFYLVEGGLDPCSHGLRQGIHRWKVDANNTYRTTCLQENCALIQNLSSYLISENRAQALLAPDLRQARYLPAGTVPVLRRGIIMAP